jgi:hypothetical protein
VSSVGGLGDELRRIAEELPLEWLATAMYCFEEGQARFVHTLQGSVRPEAREALAALAQLGETIEETQRLVIGAQIRIVQLAAKFGAGGTEVSSDLPAPVDFVAKLVDRFRRAASKTPKPIPVGWAPELARNKKGVVFQRPGAPHNADLIRVMDPTPEHPGGYIRVHNRYRQPVDVHGKPRSDDDTHVPLDYDGPWPAWPKG